MRLRLTARANRDLLNIAEYINRENPAAATSVCQRIEQSLMLLESAPYIGRKGQLAGVRELLVRGLPFLIIYQIKDVDIQVLTIFHTSRSPENK